MRRCFAFVAWALAGPAFAAQITFEQATRDLASTDAGARLVAVQMLKDAAYPEAALPLARLVTDPEDEVQLEAIAAEINIYLVEKIVSRKRIGLVVERRNRIAAEQVFAAGPAALETRPVPLDVLTALRSAARDDNPRVALEALYAFGALAAGTDGSGRRELVRTSGPDLAAMLGAPDPAKRFAALRVMGSLFERRNGDEPIDENVGDAVIVALNDGDRVLRGAAVHALGAMRYLRGIQALSDLFQYLGKGELAEAALDAVARIAHPSSAVLLTSQLTSKTAAIRGIAIEGLARMGDPAVLGSIDGAIRGERSDGVLLAGGFASAMLSDAPIDPITEALGRPRQRDQARRYLVELAPRRAPAFAQRLQDPDPRVRADLVEAVGLARDPAALPVIEPMAKDADAQVARAAERAVARLKGVASLSGDGKN